MVAPHLTRPSWLLPEPVPLPERQGRPWLEGQALRLLAGPERIEAGWWDGPAAARDYFVAATPAGVLVWIYRARLPQTQAEGGWMLQGWFG
jgi:protein ImuB